MKHNTPLTLKEIIDALTEIYKQHGFLDVEIDTQDGDLYELWSIDQIVVKKSANGKKIIAIG